MAESCEHNCPYIDLLTRELDAIHKSQDTMNATLSQMSTDIALLKYKSGLFGAMAGLIPGIISSVAVYFSAVAK
jgi:hypothetical protein